MERVARMQRPFVVMLVALVVSGAIGCAHRAAFTPPGPSPRPSPSPQPRPHPATRRGSTASTRWIRLHSRDDASCSTRATAGSSAAPSASTASPRREVNLAVALRGSLRCSSSMEPGAAHAPRGPRLPHPRRQLAARRSRRAGPHGRTPSRRTSSSPSITTPIPAARTTGTRPRPTTSSATRAPRWTRPRACIATCAATSGSPASGSFPGTISSCATVTRPPPSPRPRTSPIRTSRRGWCSREAPSRSAGALPRHRPVLRAGSAHCHGVRGGGA